MVQLCYYGFLGNEGICLTLLIQTFYSSVSSVLHVYIVLDVYTNNKPLSYLISPIQIKFHSYSSHILLLAKILPAC